MICPSCKGDGEYSFPEATSVDMSSGWYTCDRCHGTGEIKKCVRCGCEAASDELFWPSDAGADDLCQSCWEKECDELWWGTLAAWKLGAGWDYRYMWS
ncbi:hypothetical protein DSCO28_50610 [Desulfosarcina ovata subsp. sediminis]|uniref:Uncharacterized protein n=1 Tax=Desulfosarcina ovata subsp. sediminis TaxID=885957 RepID=A0A5K7ZW58_9BACT|nr:hypothetical protein DSCO28_50610 [Desulfosarcina ovata subsp. sediminis]